MTLVEQIERIERETGRTMEPDMVNVLVDLESLRAEGGDVLSSWAIDKTEVSWAKTCLGETPRVEGHTLDCGAGASIWYDGYRVELYGWARGVGSVYSVPCGSPIWGLVDWALSQFHEVEWEQVSRGQ